MPSTCSKRSLRLSGSVRLTALIGVVIPQTMSSDTSAIWVSGDVSELRWNSRTRPLTCT